MCHEFLAYPPFVEAINRLFSMIREECPEHLDKVANVLEQRGNALGVQDFTALLIETRAELSHFIFRDLHKRDRLLEESYWSMSFLCLRLATLLIEYESDVLLQE
jgi:hypothetical protein